MKKRILAFFLTLVMLFSCLSLNIFAAEGESTEGTATENAQTTPDHTDEEILSFIKELTAVKKADGTPIYSYNKCHALKNNDVTNPGGRFSVSEDGRLVYGQRTEASDDYLALSDQANGTAGRGIIASYKDNPVKGKSFVVQAEIELTSAIFTDTGTKQLFKLGTYMSPKGYNGSQYRLGVSDAVYLNLNITEDSVTLQAFNGSSKELVDVMDLEIDKKYTIAMHVDPQDVDEGSKIYGSWDLYVNGERKKERFGFLTEVTNKYLTIDEKHPFFTNSAFTSDKYAGGAQTAYFFTDNTTDEYKYTYADVDGKIVATKTAGSDGIPDFAQEDLDGSGIPDVYEKVINNEGNQVEQTLAKADGALTADDISKITVKTIGKASGVKDYCFAYARFLTAGVTNFTGNAIYLDNALAYYTESGDSTYVDVTAHNYNLCECTLCKKIEHNFDAHAHEDGNKVYTCTKCGTKTVEAMTTDYSALTGTGNLLTPEEIIATEGLNVRVATEVAEGETTLYNGKKELTTAPGKETGNYYYSYKNSSTEASTGSSYLQQSMLDTVTYNGKTQTNGYITAIGNFEKYHGQSYTISFDFLLGENFTAPSSPVQLIETFGYMGYDSTKNCLTTVYFKPLYLSPELKLYCGIKGNSSKETYATEYSLEKGQWYNVLIYHTPENNTFDLFVNGECIGNNVPALSDTYLSNLKYELEITEETIIKDKDGKDRTEVVKAFFGSKLSSTKEDYMPNIVRFVQRTTTDKEYYGFDNIKIYRTETNIECTHKCTTSNVCDLCGVELDYNWCDECGGHVLADGAAVAERSVTLGDKIAMNLYLNITDAVKNTEGAEVVVTVDGKENARLPLAELVKGEDGKYKVTALLRSIDMTKDVTVAIEGVTARGTYTTSVFEYLTALNKTSDNDKEKALITAMKNYGAYAQTYFAAIGNIDETGVLANKDLLSYVKSVDTEANPASANRLSVTENTSGGKIAITAASLVLANETRMKLYFEAPEDATVTVDGEEVTKYAGEKNGEWYVIVSRATPAALGENFAIEITSEDGKLNANVSILSAVDAIFEVRAEVGADYVNLAKAIYEYYEAANAYAELNQQ